MEYINKKYNTFFKDNKLTNFEKILNNEKMPWFEDPNIGRDGLSGVKKVNIENKDNAFNVYIKIQKNYFVNNKLNKLLPFIKRTLVAQREFKNIRNIQKYNIPACEVLYFSNKANEAIFITKELSGYHSLESVLKNIHGCIFPKDDVLRKIAKSLAIELAKLHKSGFSHNCLYPKHIFVNSEFQIAFIDFEKCKKINVINNYSLRDIECLFYHVSEILNPAEQYCIDIKNNFFLKKLYYYFINIYVKNLFETRNKELIKSKIKNLFRKTYKRSLKKRAKYLNKK